MDIGNSKNHLGIMHWFNMYVFTPLLAEARTSYGPYSARFGSRT